VVGSRGSEWSASSPLRSSALLTLTTRDYLDRCALAANARDTR